MGSKGRVPPHMRMPLSGPGMFSPEPFGSGGHPPHGALPHDVMPPRDIIEQKLAVQHNEMKNLAMENQRLAATHSALRHELAASQHEFQRLQAHMSGSRFEHEQQMMAIFDKIGKMEAELKASDPLKLELQQAQSEAQNLAAGRQELIAKVQELTQDLQKNHGEAHQIPSLISELDALRQEYEHSRSTYDYERKLRIDHYESLQVMEKNYVSMLGEVEKLQKELSNSTHADKSGGPYGSNMGYKENDVTGQHSTGKNAYEDGYRVPQGLTGPASGGAQYGGAPARAAQVPSRPGYEAARNTAYEAAPRSTVYDTSGAPHFETSRGSSYEPPRGSTYDAPRGSGPGYEAHGVTGAAQGTTAAANPVPPYMMGQGQASYGSSAQGPASYGSSAQGPAAYGSSAQGPAAYGSSAQGPAAYGSSAQGPAAYGSSAQGPAAYGSSAQGPAAYGSSAQGPAAYGSSAQGPAAYGSSAQGPAAYGSSAQGPAAYGAPHMQGPYGTPQTSTRAGPGYEAPARGAPATGGAGANQRHR